MEPSAPAPESPAPVSAISMPRPRVPAAMPTPAEVLAPAISHLQAAPSLVQPAAPRHNAPLLTPDQRAEAEAMYVQGATAAQIGSVYGLTRAQVNGLVANHGWAEKRSALRKAKAVLDAAQGSDKRAVARERVLDDMSEVVEEGVQFLKKNPPKTRRQLREHFSAAREIMEVAKPVLGVASEPSAQGPSLVNMQFLMAPEKFIRAKTIEAETSSA